MYRVSRVVCSSVKRSTGIVGLSVVPNARAVLTALYEKTLTDVKIIPAGVAYREQVENFTKERLAVVKANEEIHDIERIIGMGQVEELIEEAKSELELIPAYASWKAWEATPASPADDEYADFYRDLAGVDPESVEYLGLKQMAAKKQEQVAAERAAAKAAADAAAAKAAADAAAAAAAAAPKTA